MNRRGFFGKLVGTIAAAAIFGETLISKAPLPVPRRLKARWSIELEQDLMALHGLNADQEIFKATAQAMAEELDREFTRIGGRGYTMWTA